MKMTGKRMTDREGRHFQSLARHMNDIATPLVRDLVSSSRANWTNLDRSYATGKLNDFKAKLRDLQEVLDDMGSELFED